MPQTANRRAVRGRILLVSFWLFLAVPAVAQAGTETLSRSVTNMLFGPMDVVTSPVVAGRGIVTNLQDIDDTTGVRVAYTVPGFFWYTGVTIGAGVIRTATGILELIPGLVLLPFDTELTPLMPPVQDASALVDIENDYFPIKFGIDYTSAE